MLVVKPLGLLRGGSCAAVVVACSDGRVRSLVDRLGRAWWAAIGQQKKEVPGMRFLALTHAVWGKQVACRSATISVIPVNLQSIIGHGCLHRSDISHGTVEVTA